MKPPSNDRRRDCWIAGALFLACALTRLPLVGIGYLTLHSARDIYRALELIHFGNVPLAGPELYFGGKIPGNFYYILHSVPLIFWHSPWAVAAWQALLSAAVGPIAYFALRPVASRLACVVGVLIYAFYPLAVVENIYLWNPCYLPPMMSLGLFFLVRWATSGRRVYWSLLLLTGLLTIQIHLSAYILIVLAIVGPLLRRWTMPKSEATAAADCEPITLLDFLWPLAVVLPMMVFYLWDFGPFYFIDISLPAQGDRTVGILSGGINMTALTTLQRVLVFQDDTSTVQEFVHFMHFFKLLRAHPFFYALAHDGTRMASILSTSIYFTAGLVVFGGLLFGGAVRRARLAQRLFDDGGSAEDAEAPDPARLRALRLVVASLAVWLVLPMIPLIKMTGNNPAGDEIGIPTRYFIIFYPLIMLFQGIGAAVLYRTLSRRYGRVALVALLPLAQALAFYGGFDALFIRQSYRSGGVTHYLVPLDQYSKPLYMESALCDVLASYGADHDDFLDRLLTDGHFSELHSEQYLEYPLFYDLDKMPGAPDDLWFYLWDARRHPEPPALILESGEVVAVHKVNQFRIMVLRRPDPAKPVIWPRGQLEPVGIR